MTIIGKQDRDLPLPEVYASFDLNDSIPKHIAMIMDGNGRWAKKRFLPRIAGHKKGMDTVRKMVKACLELNIHYLSLYAFSTENWKRPEDEVSFLMGLLNAYITNEIPSLKKENVRIKFKGDIGAFPDSIQKQIRYAETETESNTALQVNIMLNYGSRLEILNAIKTIGAKLQNKSLAIDDITETLVSETLYSSDTPDPELMIRTSGEKRLSNFMLWQISYSELIFTKTLWPDFNKKELIKALKEYQERQRRFGGI